MNLNKIFSNPNSKSYKIIFAIASVTITVAMGFFISQAGSLNPTSAPTTTTMYTLDDIYCKLTGCTPAAHSLDSPGTPGSTMHTLAEIYAATPDFKNSPGSATAGDVCNGATFYKNTNTLIPGIRTSCYAQGQVQCCGLGYCSGWCQMVAGCSSSTPLCGVKVTVSQGSGGLNVVCSSAPSCWGGTCSGCNVWYQ